MKSFLILLILMSLASCALDPRWNNQAHHPNAADHGAQDAANAAAAHQHHHMPAFTPAF